MSLCRNIACSAGVFIGRARMVLIAKAPCWNSRREEEMGRVKGRGEGAGRKKRKQLKKNYISCTSAMYAHQVKCTMPTSYRIYFWYKKAYAYLFYKKNVASQVLRMMLGRHLFFPFLKTWVETREGKSTNSMWANPWYKKTHLNTSLDRTQAKIYKPLTSPSLHSVAFVNHNSTKLLVKGWIGLL